MKAIGYVRVSTQEQAQEGVSLEAQRAQIQAYCAAKGWQLVEICADEGISGKTIKKRPGLVRALQLLDAHQGEVLVITKLDRLSRSALDVLYLAQERFTKNGATLCSIHESLDATTAFGRAMMGILAVLGQMEREQLSERTAAALQHKMARGDHQGNVPYGWRAGEGPGGRMDRSRWLAVPAEQAVIKRVKQLRRQGLSLRAIQAKVNAGGAAMTLSRVLRICGYKRRR